MQSSKAQDRRQKIQSIRQSLKTVSIIKKTTLQIESKVQKIRKKSECFTEALFDKELADSLSQSSSDQSNNCLFNDHYTMGEKIGEGAHGVVRKCYSKESGQLFAAKTFQVDREHIIFLKQNFIDIKKLSHPNVIGYKALFFQMNSQKCHLVMDYLPFPDLNQIPIKTEHWLKEITHQIVQTLAYIHSHKICHRDIKPENVLYDKKRHRIILIDFGISRKLTKRGIKRDMLTLTGTPYYRAPQMFEGGGYDELVDIWALGVTIFKMMAGITPFESEYHSQTIANIMKGEVVFPPQVEARFSRQAQKLVTRLLKRRSDRLTAKQTLNDLWFIDIEKKIDQNTKSMTIDNKLGHHTFNVSIHLPILQRNNTNIRQIKKAEGEQTLQQVIKSLKCLDEYAQEEDSRIYGCPDEDQYTSPTLKFNR